MKRIKLIISILASLILLGFMHSHQVYAASASISAGNTSVNVGQSVTLTITIKGASWGVNLSGAVSGGYSDTTDDAEDGTKTYTTTFTPTEEGTYKINLSGTVTGASDSKATSVDDSVTIIAKNPTSSSASGSSSSSTTNTNSNSGTEQTQTASSNANLSNLGVVGYDFTGFTPNKTSYNTSVPNSVTSVSIYANLQNSGATYTVSGNTNLDVGTNKITVTVTAEDKTTKKNYYIYVARASESNENVVPNVIEENTEETQENVEKEKLGLISIAIEDGYEIYLEPEFKNDIYEYVINLKEDLEKIPLNAIANRENAKVEITGNENLQEGENLIKITVTDEEETTEYKISVNKILDNEENTKLENIEIDNKEKAGYNTEENMWIFILIALVIFIIAIVAFIIINKRRHKKEFLYEESEEIEEAEKIENKESVKKEKRIKGKGKHF